MRIRRTHSNHFVHGHSRIGHITPEFTAYFNAKKRCTRRCGKDFKNYGRRGIKFLFKSFAEFLKAVGRKPSPDHVLDRVNNDGHYESGNVRWTTRSESSKNQRMTIKRLRAMRNNMRKSQKFRWLKQ
jgi:hypothetical protein